MKSKFLLKLAIFCILASASSLPVMASDLNKLVLAVEDRVIEWRRDIHQHPELSNRETRTAALVADHLRTLGFDSVETGIAHTGVVGILKGARPGPVVALRADMDALPVTEQVDVPFASKVRTIHNGEEVGVMHACGHDAHTAILMGVAEVLASMRDEIAGTIKFIFQPAEEGAPIGEKGGARLMIEEGVLDGEFAPQAIFGLHVGPDLVGRVAYRARGVMAAVDELRITVHGRQTHGALPWTGIDPIIVSAQILLGLQTIPSRQMDVTRAQSVVTVGSIRGGVRGNIIPNTVEMVGTIRTFDREMREDLIQRIDRTVTSIAESAGASADVEIIPGAPVTYNDPELTAQMVPSLRRAVGGSELGHARIITVSEDFAFYQERIPGLYVFLGVNKAGVLLGQAPGNHSPFFYVNEDALKVGVNVLAMLALDYLELNGSGE